MIHDLPIIIFSWVLFSSLSLLSLPLLTLLFQKHTPDSGWAWGRVTGWLLISVPIWFLAHLGLPINTTSGVWVSFFIILAVSIRTFRQNKSKLVNLWKNSKKLIIAEEIIFAIGFVFLCVVRGFQPNIEGLEKFMDAGLMVSYLNSSKLPIADMWLAGYDFNYYTFGHFLGSVATQIIHQPIAISYNIMLGFVMGLTLIQSFGVVTFLLKSVKRQSHQIIAGVVGALLVTVAGNTQNIIYFITNGTFQGFWYPDSTRFIPKTIHEFPSYSFIVSDLHAHVWSMVLVLLIIPLILLWAETALEKSWQNAKTTFLKMLLCKAGLIGGLLGLIASTSTWDFMIYGSLLGLVGLVVMIINKGKNFRYLVFSALVVILCAAITASPWFLNFNSISEGIRLVQERSEVWRFMVLWAGMLICSASATGLAIFKMKKLNLPEYWQVIAIAVLSWILLLLPEFIYFKDIYPAHPRANTMFKFTFQAFIMMQIITGWLLGQLIANLNLNKMRICFWAWLSQTLPLFFLSVYIIAILIYPYFGYRDYYGLKQYKGLDGLQWLAQQYPNDYLAMKWLKNHVAGRPVVLEAVGESYTTFSRVSSFTGLVTVLGWPVHEWLWRGGYDIPGKRVEEVKNMYNLPLSAESLQKFNEYKIKYIFIGDKEREAYPQLSLAELKKLGPIVFESGQTIIIEIGGKTIPESSTGPIEFR